MNDKFIALIPARSGSKGIRHKNLKKIGDSSLISWSIQAAKSISKVEKIVFSSDSKYYINHARKFNPDFLHLRSKKNSSDKAKDIDYFKEVIKHLESKNCDFRYIVLLRPTTPLRSRLVLNNGLKFFTKNKHYFSSMRSINLMSESALKTFYYKNKSIHSIIGESVDVVNNPRNLFNSTYAGNGYIDIIDKNLVKYKDLLFGKKVLGFETKFAFEIDNKQDYKYASYEYITNKKKYDRIKHV